MPGPSGELRTAVDALAAEARAQWPGAPLSDDAFAAAVMERLDPGEEPLAALRQLRAADLWLALACARGDERALRIFDDRYLSKVPSLIRRVDGHGELAPEVMQDLRAQLLIARGGRARIEDYSGRGDLLGWLRVVALRAALKLRRRKLRLAGEPLEGDAARELLSGADPERDYLRLRYRGAYEDAFKEAMAALDAPARLLLKLHYADALSLPRLAAMYRVHRATIARRLADARRRLLDDTRALLQQRLRLSESEFESVLGLVRSQLAFSVRSALS